MDNPPTPGIFMRCYHLAAARLCAPNARHLPKGTASRMLKNWIYRAIFSVRAATTERLTFCDSAASKIVARICFIFDTSVGLTPLLLGSS
jgi:hypothetical protein